MLRRKHKNDTQSKYTPDQLAAARLASKRGVELRSAQGNQTFDHMRMSDDLRRKAHESLRRSLTTT